MNDRLSQFDFAAHNEEVRWMWDAFRARRPYRVPIIFGANTRFFILNGSANPGGLEFRAYSEDPDIMFDALLRFARWSRFNLLQDAELGLPEKWVITPDFQNYYEAAWFGCEIEYLDGQVPDTRPAFANRPKRVMEHGLPDPFGGLMGRGREYYEHFKARAAREQYLGRPIEISPPTFAIGTDGPMTVACDLFGPEFVCTAMASEPELLASLLMFITDATIARMKGWRRYLGLPIPQDGWGFADDSIALISTDMYRRHVLPHHRRLCDAIASEGPRFVHLCGDATRHFITLRDELNVQTFDTGFPVDFSRLRRELGPHVTILGGPRVELLRTASPGRVSEEVERLLHSGATEGGLFILREGNNLAPYTPIENCEAMYQAGRKFGQLIEEPVA